MLLTTMALPLGALPLTRLAAQQPRPSGPQRNAPPPAASAIPRFRVGMGLAVGRFGFEESGAPNRDDRTDALAARLQLEGFGRRSFGGGFRLEGLRSDDDLFGGATGNPTEATDRSLYGHFSWLAHERRFGMRIRIGLLADRLTLDEQTSATTFTETEFTTVGPYFELEPELVVLERGRLRASVYGTFGLGGGWTWIDAEGDGRDWDSVTGLLGIETGVRFRYGALELVTAYVGRFRTMDRSDSEGGTVIPEHDASLHTLFFGFGIAL